MCGIAGYYGLVEVAPERIAACLKLMRRRGPDAAGHTHTINSADRHLNLLHTRLSIIDLDQRANQPFQAAGKRMVFNGEVYNYLELRSELASKGRAFRTQSDTEVLLAAIDEFGWDVLDRAEGMWAFAVWDEREESLTLCRDRFGEKPLYLYRDDTGLYFGSEAKFLFALLGRSLSVNQDQVCRYLVNGYKALYKNGHTFFLGLSELPPATTLRLDREGGEVRRRYWQPRFTPQEEMTCQEAVAGARERLIHSVELRLRADVPLAFCMSGGVDSNSLISIARRSLGYDVHGFTIANTDARYEEQGMIDHAVAALGIRHTSIPVNTGEFLPRLRTLVRQHDAPVYTISYYAHWLLMEAVAAHGYKIAVSGTAADELFTGYYDHHLAYLCEVREDPSRLAQARTAWQEQVQPFVRNPWLSDPNLFLRDPAFRGHIFLGASEFARRLRDPWQESFSETLYTPSLLRNRMLNEMFHESVPVILHEDDLNAMYYSIENRSPFLDRSLFEFCYTIPARHLIRDGRAKAVLRDAMRGIVPDPILDNPRKVGFNAPIFSFLDVTNPEVRSALLEPSPIFDVVRRDAIERILAEDDLPNSESKFLFCFLAGKMFLEEFGH